MEWITNPQAWIALATLATLEIVLGIDNIVFISILSQRLPLEQQPAARRLGLLVAMATRILLLLSISLILRLTTPLFELFGHAFAGRDIILGLGGLFLLTKSTREIHDKLEGEEHAEAKTGWAGSFWGVILQIMILDLVFSLDSVITAVGMADDLGVMITAIVLAVVVMMLSAEVVSDFVLRHPTVKMLALSFLILIGMSLVAEALGQHIPKGYIYFAMGFSLFVESLNLRAASKKTPPVHLRSNRPAAPEEVTPEAG